MAQIIRDYHNGKLTKRKQKMMAAMRKVLNNVKEHVLRKALDYAELLPENGEKNQTKKRKSLDSIEGSAEKKRKME